MTDDDVEYVAREMVGRFGAEAVRCRPRTCQERRAASARLGSDLARYRRCGRTPVAGPVTDRGADGQG